MSDPQFSMDEQNPIPPVSISTKEAEQLMTDICMCLLNKKDGTGWGPILGRINMSVREDLDTYVHGTFGKKTGFGIALHPAIKLWPLECRVAMVTHMLNHILMGHMLMHTDQLFYGKERFHKASDLCVNQYIDVDMVGKAAVTANMPPMPMPLPKDVGLKEDMSVKNYCAELPEELNEQQQGQDGQGQPQGGGKQQGDSSGQASGGKGTPDPNGQPGKGGSNNSQGEEEQDDQEQDGSGESQDEQEQDQQQGQGQGKQNQQQRPKGKGGYQSKAQQKHQKQQQQNHYKSPKGHFDKFDMIDEQDEVAKSVAQQEFCELARRAKETQHAGLVPGEMVEQFTPKDTPPVVMLSQWLTAVVTSTQSEKRTYRMSRLSRHGNPDEPPANLTQPVPVVFGMIDTSGSMSTEDIMLADPEFKEVWQAGIEIWWASCDTQVYDLKKYDGESISGVQGRGGTSFLPIMQYADECQQPRADAVAVLTDGYGSDNGQLKVDTVPVLFILTPNGMDLKEFRASVPDSPLIYACKMCLDGSVEA